MELKNYFNILKRWALLLIIFTILGAGSGYVVSRILKPTYQATTRILVSKYLSDQDSLFAAMTNQQLVDTYVQMLTSSSVTDEASRRLGYPIDLQNIGQVQQVRTTLLIQITIEDGDPQRAATIANTLVEVLIDQNSQANGYALTEDNINKMITQVEGQISTFQTQFNQISDENLQGQLQQANAEITTLQNDVSTLSAEIGPLASKAYLTAEQSSQLTEKQAQLAQLQSLLAQYQQLSINLEYFGKPALNSSDLGGDVRLQLLQSTVDQYQKIYLNLLDNLHATQLASLRSATTIDQIEKATPPTIPARPLPLVYTILAGIVGLVFGTGVIYITEYLDDTLKTPQDIQQVFDVPVFDYFPNFEPVSKTEPGLPVARQLNPQTSEALYALRTNLEFFVAHPPLKTLLILSANEPGKGKTSMAADLAVSYAQSGCKVVLLDADLRNSSIHRYFGLANENGFSDLLVDDLMAEEVGKKIEGLDGMTVITGGNASPETSRLLKPERIAQILKLLKKQSDVIIVDAPFINDANSWVLASKMDGVLLVVQPRVTHLKEARQSLEQINRSGATILGVVLYHIPHNFAQYNRSIRKSAKEGVKETSSTLPNESID